MTKKQTNISVVEGVSIDKNLMVKLQERLAEKNQDKILEALEKISYHKSAILALQTEIENLTKLS